MILQFFKILEKFIFQLNPKIIKAWHLHKEATLNYVCVRGKVELALYDDREQSKSKGEYQKIFFHRIIIF